MQSNSELRLTSTRPVYQKRQAFLDLLRDHSIILFQGATGSGKSSQIPALVMFAMNGRKVACTQPRIIATVELANRVASELGVKVGDDWGEVGYVFRGEDKSLDASLVFMTDGMFASSPCDVLR